jgi:hypothetical protein
VTTRRFFVRRDHRPRRTVATSAPTSRSSHGNSQLLRQTVADRLDDEQAHRLGRPLRVHPRLDRDDAEELPASGEEGYAIGALQIVEVMSPGV